MTPDEINKCLAVEVLGWVAWSEYDPPLPYQITYRDAAGNVMSPIAYRPHWNPYHSIADAMRVVEKMKIQPPDNLGDGLIVDFAIVWSSDRWIVGWQYEDCDERGMKELAIHADLPAALCLAAVEWAKAKVTTP